MLKESDLFNTFTHDSHVCFESILDGALSINVVSAILGLACEEMMDAMAKNMLLLF